MNGRNYSISRPVFWGATVIAGLSLVLWFVSGTRHLLSTSGIIVYIFIQTPVFFGVATACGWLVAAMHALVTQRAKAAEEANAQPQSKPGVGRLTVAAMIGGCFATTIIIVWGSESLFCSLELAVVPFLIGSALAFFLMRILWKTRHGLPPKGKPWGQV